MESSKPPGFWQTVPGILTALAGVITAVAGLLVAYDQIRARSPRDPDAGRPPAVTQSAADSRPSPASAPSPAVSSVPAGVAVLIVGPPNEVRFKAGELTYRVLAARLEPSNQDTRLLSVNLRVINNMTTFDRNYYSELRALADDLPLAPEDPPYVQTEAHSVKDIPYMFRVPTGVHTLTLRISHMEEAGEIPLHLK
jgi:hypothetical protein